MREGSMTNQQQGYWYLASYPKSGNTWCRVFITELLRLAGEDPSEELNLNRGVETGAIALTARHFSIETVMRPPAARMGVAVVAVPPA
jgi:hypothetical protein